MYWMTDDAGEPIPIENAEEWAMWWAQSGIRKVAEDFVGQVRVSTVFLGISHGYRADNPDLWETMVFGGKLDDAQERYTTLHEAMEGHSQMLRKVMMAEYCAGMVKK